ncbi:MAG: ATP-binding cassette domain-containing protein [Hyphomonas sp.]
MLPPGAAAPWSSPANRLPSDQFAGRARTMSASITRSSLNFALPDGRVLFSDLDFSFNQGRSGLTGANGAVKSTLLRLIAGELAPSAGRVLYGRAPWRAALAALRRAETGEADAWEDADWTLEAHLAEALGRAGLDAAPETRLAALSGGQRARRARGAGLHGAGLPAAGGADEQSRPRRP